MSDRVIDFKGTEIMVGCRIAPYFYKGEMTTPAGVVTRVTDADGDVDDYGRQYMVGPRVYVRYDDGFEDDFLAHTDYGTYDFICDDVEVEAS